MNVPNQPWMSQEEINLVLSFLKKDDIMLEYGCGGSTMFFPKYVKEYYSIESDKSWANSVEKIMPKNVKMHCIPTIRPEDPNQKHAVKWNQLYTTKMYEAYKEYIETGSKINKKFTKILIDGRARPQCARYMYDFIDKDCIIFMHDWHPGRTHYRSILEKYRVIKETRRGQMIAALTKI
jgi:mRNA degradation ribonuclease J1/J2